MLGKRGETIAMKILEARGHTILRLNYRSPYGEIDILSREQNTIVATEVKTRSRDVYGQGEESITPLKLKHIRHSLYSFLDSYGQSFVSLRIDVLCLVLVGNRLTACTYYEGVG